MQRLQFLQRVKAKVCAVLPWGSDAEVGLWHCEFFFDPDSRRPPILINKMGPA
jgi:hypothetical protein